jgi:hypothetical protein
MQKLQNYPITTITYIKQSKRKDKLGTIKIFTSYKCKWIQLESHLTEEILHYTTTQTLV